MSTSYPAAFASGPSPTEAPPSTDQVGTGAAMPLTVAGVIARRRKPGPTRADGVRHEDVDVEGPREALHPRGEVDRVADDGELHELPGAEHPRDHPAEVNPYAESELGEAPARQLRVVPGEGLPHRQRGANGVVGLPGVVPERPEQGEDAVANELGDMTVVRADRAAHPLEVPVEDADEHLGLQVLGHRGEAAEVGEQRGDLAVLGGDGQARVCDVVHDLARGEPAERELQVLELPRGPRVALLVRSDQAPVALDRHQKAARGSEGERPEEDGELRHVGSERMPRRTSPFASAAVPITSTSVPWSTPSANCRARSWNGVTS